MISCSSSVKRNERFIQQLNQYRPYFDRLKIFASLNDTIFSLSRINPWMDSVALRNNGSIDVYSDLNLPTDNTLPIVTYRIVNISQDTLTIPEISYYYCDCTEASCTIGTIVCIGTDDGRIKKPYEWLNVEYMYNWGEEFECTTLFPGDTFCTDCTIYPFRINNITSIEKGNYWVTLLFNNYHTGCSSTYVPWTNLATSNKWVGYIVSDTLWFEVAN
jgi:hypothetical protein